MAEWLIRTQKNQILGPFSHQEVRDLILNQKIQLQDELCPSEGYWFFLHDKEELEKQFGLSISENLSLQHEVDTDAGMTQLLQKGKKERSPVSDAFNPKNEEPEITTFVSRSKDQHLEVPFMSPKSAGRPKVIEKKEGPLASQNRFQRWLKLWLGICLGLILLGWLLRVLLGSI